MIRMICLFAAIAGAAPAAAQTALSIDALATVVIGGILSSTLLTLLLLPALYRRFVKT